MGKSVLRRGGKRKRPSRGTVSISQMAFRYTKGRVVPRLGCTKVGKEILSRKGENMMDSVESGRKHDVFLDQKWGGLIPEGRTRRAGGATRRREPMSIGNYRPRHRSLGVFLSAAGG